jgi:hypothetical protein
MLQYYCSYSEKTVQVYNATESASGIYFTNYKFRPAVNCKKVSRFSRRVNLPDFVSHFSSNKHSKLWSICLPEFVVTILHTWIDSRDSSVGTVTATTGWVSGKSRFDFWRRQENSHVFIMSRSTLGPTQASIQRVLGAVSPGVKPQTVKLATHLHLGSSLRMMERNLHSLICFHWLETSFWLSFLNLEE